MTQEEEEDDHQHLMKYHKKTSLIAGIDEVGKGSLFGPVFAGAVILEEENGQKLVKLGLKDSKLLTAKKRAELVPKIKKFSISWGIGEASANEIDSLGIRLATEKAMLRAIKNLSIQPELLLVDGSLPIKIWPGKQNNLIKGESKSIQIAAASVIAKEARDEIIKGLSFDFPNYGLETNVGYGTIFHRQAIVKLGATKMHRRSFLSKIIPI